MQLTASQIASRAVELGLVTKDQIQLCWDALGQRGGPAGPFVQVMQRRGLLTALQADRLLNGQADALFIDRFKLLYRVGSGTFSRVYRAEDTTTKAIYALKVLRQRWLQERDMVALFRREGEVATTLRHPNIVRTYGVEQKGNQHYIIMEFIPGGNLRDFIRNNTRLDPMTAVRLAADVARGLTYASGRNLSHRDIKPTNILLTEDRVAKLVDFGLADLNGDSTPTTPNSNATRTVEYATLERETNVPKGDARSDIFFLGAVLFHMLTGEPPFPEAVSKSRLIRRRFDTPPSIVQAAPDCPVPVQRVVAKMLSFEPDHRHQHISAVLQELTVVERMLTARQAAAPSRAAPAKNAAASEHARTILLVEQNEDVQQLIRTRLTKLGYRLIVTTNGTRGAQRFEANPTDAVLFDLDGLNESGVLALFKIKQLGVSNVGATPIILMRGKHYDPAVEERIGKLRVDAVLMKPVSLRELRHAVEKLVPLKPTDTA